MAFNPFIKAIGEVLTSDDLEGLIERQVAEGSYVEYKTMFPANEKIANSIASFANTYGGWYIVGVHAESTDNTAKTIVGFSLNEFPDPISKVREIAKSRIDPFPAISPQVVTLANGRVCLVVRIPGNQQKPFISSNGRIYRRKADSSDPIFETDRYAIDRLYEEGQEPSKDFEHFLDDDVFATEASSLKIFLAPSPERISADDVWSYDDADTFLERSRVARPIQIFGSAGLTGNAPYATCQLTHESLILRQRPALSVSEVSAQLELFNDGRGKISLPLAFSEFPNEKEIKEFPSHETRKIFESLFNSEAFLNLRLLDVAVMIAAVGTHLSYYLEWVTTKGPITEFRIAVKLDRVRNVVPFFISDDWAAHVQNYGLPIVERNSIWMPSGRKRSFLLDADPDANLSVAQLLCYVIGNALGLPSVLQAQAFFDKYVPQAENAIATPS